MLPSGCSSATLASVARGSGRGDEAAGGEEIETGADSHKISGKDNRRRDRHIPAIRHRLERSDRSAATLWIAPGARDPGNSEDMGSGDAVARRADPDRPIGALYVEAVRPRWGRCYPKIAEGLGGVLLWLREGRGQLVGTSLNAASEREGRYGADLPHGRHRTQGLRRPMRRPPSALKIPMMGRATAQRGCRGGGDRYEVRTSAATLSTEGWCFPAT